MHIGTPQRRTNEDSRIVRHRNIYTTIYLDKLTRCLVAINALSKTVTLLTQAGRFRQAADREKEIGQIYLQDAQDLSKACESFERAGEWYAQEDAMA
jgi:hypothetical protein